MKYEPLSLSDSRVALIVALVALAVLANTLLFVGSFPGVRVTAAATATLPMQRDVYRPVVPGEVLAEVTAANVYMSSEGSSPLPLMKYHADEAVPLASLTKIMTALTVLTYGPVWDESVTITAEDRRPGARQRLYPGDTVTVADLWKLLLIASDNDAAAALARHMAGSEQAFVDVMHTLAKSWSLPAVTFADASGLSDGNRASARDFAVIARKAFVEERIVTAASVTDSTVLIGSKAERIFNTDQILQDKAETSTYGWTLIAGKTGHTEEAGYNIALLATNIAGEEVLMVLLGGRTAADRAQDVLRLVPWALSTTAALPTGERYDERLLY